MQINRMSFSRRDTASGRCERPAGAKNLGFVPQIASENEILRRSAPQNDIVWRFCAPSLTKSLANEEIDATESDTRWLRYFQDWFTPGSVTIVPSQCCQALRFLAGTDIASDTSYRKN